MPPPKPSASASSSRAPSADLEKTRGRLANDNFVRNAPEPWSRTERQRRSDLERTVSNLTTQLERVRQLLQDCPDRERPPAPRVPPGKLAGRGVCVDPSKLEFERMLALASMATVKSTPASDQPMPVSHAPQLSGLAAGDGLFIVPVGTEIVWLYSPVERLPKPWRGSPSLTPRARGLAERDVRPALQRSSRFTRDGAR